MSQHPAYIAVHGGAGMHSTARERDIKHALKLSCRQALNYINPDGHETKALDLVENAISHLEDDSNFNAGYGSNLNLHGTVECDAAIMDGLDGDFGSVGALSGVRNPISVAHAILEHSRSLQPLGQIPPLTLVAEGARSFAAAFKARKIQLTSENSLVSEAAKKDRARWKARLETYSYSAHTSMESQGSGTGLSDIQDTVGAIAYQNTIAAGVSSGGILLKHPGRLGEAAIFGAGCWAQHFPEVGLHIACSISGAGEYVTRAMLAYAIANSFQSAISSSGDIDVHNILHTTVLENFWNPCIKRGVNYPEVGILLLTSEELKRTSTVRLWCAFTTSSMAIAYASSMAPNPKAQMLRMPESSKAAGTDKPQIFITAMTL